MQDNALVELVARLIWDIDIERNCTARNGKEEILDSDLLSQFEDEVNSVVFNDINASSSTITVS